MKTDAEFLIRIKTITWGDLSYEERKNLQDLLILDEVSMQRCIDADISNAIYFDICSINDLIKPLKSIIKNHSNENKQIQTKTA